MARVPISREANETLELWLTQLQEGQIQFADLPLSVSAWYFLGLADGRASRQLEVENLEREANRWYYLANTTPTQRRDHIERRLSQALEHATVEQWDQLDQALAAMAGQHKDSEMTEPASVDTESTHGNKAVSSPQPGIHNPQTIHGTNVAT